MEKITDEQLKRELPLDLYGRYAIIRDIINTSRKKNEKFKVLDVGGRGNLMRRFLPEDDVFYLDPFVDTNDDNFVEGDGCAMPLEDGSYDWVVSADVFEHIPKEKRENFLKENTRVAKLGVVLAAPFDSEAVRQAEVNANENYKILSGGEDHVWLKEHIANGLPKETELENFLKTKGFDFQKLHNNGIFIWESLQGISFFAGHNLNENIKKSLEDFNYFYNSEVFPYDSAEPSYRKIYFIKKDAKLKNIQEQSKSINDSLFLDTIKRAIDLVSKVDVEKKRIISQKDSEIRQKESALEKNENQLKAALSQLELVKTELVSMRLELENVYSSREWKLALAVRKLVKFLIPKNSIRRKMAVSLWGLAKKFLRVAHKLKGKLLFCKSYFHKLIKPKKPRKINLKSKKIVFIGHSYHKKTKSSAFLINYLKQFFEVKVIFDDSWQGKLFPDFSFIDESYFGVIFFQLLPPKEIRESIKNENILFFPMYGGVRLDYEFWDGCRDLKIVNFSRTLHEMLKKWGLDSMHIQYFTDLQEFIPGNKNEVFFWQRITKININTITKLFGKEKLKIHIHKGIDPYEKFIQPSQEVEKKFQITYTDWFESRDEMLEKIGGLIRQKGIYVAPRDLEGIGMSFLEAMAMGKAVIAVDNPTMNEYIEHGKTGYLFDLANPKKIDLSGLEQVQKNAYEFAQNGRKKWEKERQKIVDFIKKR